MSTSLRSIIKKCPVGILGILMYISGTDPQNAVSNISKWADIFKIPLPEFLKSKSVDSVIFWICLILLVLYIAYLVFDWLVTKRQAVEKDVKLDAGEIRNVPDTNIAKKQTIIDSVKQLIYNDGISIVDKKGVRGLFELSAPSCKSDDNIRDIKTKSDFGTHFYMSARMSPVITICGNFNVSNDAGISYQSGVRVLELVGRGVYFGVAASWDGYYIYESEENWTGWKQLTIRAQPGDTNVLSLYQTDKRVLVYLNDRYLEGLTKVKAPRPGPLGIQLKANPSTGGKIRFQDFSIWEY